MQMSFCESSNHISWTTQKNEVNANFFFLLFGTLVTVIISLYYKESILLYFNLVEKIQIRRI